MRVIGSVIAGVLDAPATSRLRAALARFDGLVEIRIKAGGIPRSVAQNAYWFSVLDDYAVPAFRAYGDNWTNWKIHEHVMEELGYQEVLVGKNGKLVPSRLHSSEFTTREWEEFMERARAYLAAEHGVYLPLPKEKI